jgi:type IV pilus assembly protein PilA
MKNNKGFTLIELIMVTIILGILAAVAVPRYMGTVSQAEAAAEKAVVDALKAAVENYATQEFLEKGRYDYPANPFDLVDVDGYCGACTTPDGGNGMEDGSWKYESTGDLHTITHQRRDNSLWYWTYDTSDRSNDDSDDRGYNIGTNGLVNGDQVSNSQQETLSN